MSDVERAATRSVRRRVWLGLGLIAVALVVVVLLATPAASDSSTDSGSGGDLVFVVALIGAVGTLIGGIASLLSALVMVARLRQPEGPPAD